MSVETENIEITKPEGEPEGGKPEGETRTYTADEFKELISQRDKVKKERQELLSELEKFKKAEADKKKKELEDEGKYSEIISAKENELNDYKTKYAEAEIFINNVKENLLNSLSDEHRKIAEKLSMTDLQEYVKLNSAKPPKTTDSNEPGSRGTVIIDGKKYDDFTSDDLENLITNDFNTYKKLYYEKYKRYPAN